MKLIYFKKTDLSQQGLIETGDHPYLILIRVLSVVIHYGLISFILP